MQLSESVSRATSRVILPLIVGALCATLTFWLVSEVGPLNMIEAKTLRTNARSLPNVIERKIVLIALKSETRKRLGLEDGSDALPRGLYGRLIHDLDRAGASTAILDITFESPKPAQDFLLKSALSHLTRLKVTLSTGYRSGSSITETENGVLGPYVQSAIFDKASMPRVQLGGAAPYCDQAGVLCGANAFCDGVEGEHRMHVSFQAAMQALDVDDRTPRYDPARNLLTVGPLEWPLEAHGRLPVQWTQSKEDIRTIELTEALNRLERPASKGEFEGAIVVIGDCRDKADDHESEPFGTISGSLFVANELNTVLKPQSARLSLLPDCLYLIVATIFGASAFGFGFSRRVFLSIMGIAGLTLLAWGLPLVLIRTLGITTATLALVLATLSAGVMGLLATQSRLYRDDHRATGSVEDATAMFVDLRGSTEILNRVGPTDYRIVVEALLSACTQIVSSHGGTIERTLGDGCLIVFRPHPGRHHSLRAADSVEPLREMARRLSTQYGIDLLLGMGIETGQVTGGYVTEAGHRTWSSAGTTINLAQRFQAATEGLGTDVVIGPTARGLICDEYLTTILGHISVKGFETMPEVATLIPQPRKPSV